MGFSHIQGAEFDQTGGSATSITVTLGSNPAAGDLVIVGFTSVGATSMSVKDSNNNAYTLSHSSPFTGGSTLSVGIAYLLSAPANATKAITVTYAPGNGSSAWAEEFSYTGGSAAYDTDSAAQAVITGTSFTNVSITPSGSGELLYAVGNPGDALTAPSAGATLGSWTGAAGGISPDTGADAEYLLSSSSGSTSIDFTDATSGDTCVGIVAAFSLGSAGPSVAQTSPGFYEQGTEMVPCQALGFYYDDDTYGPNVAGWPGIETLLAVPKTFEMDCDTVSRNFDSTRAFMREPEGELPTLTWSHGANANAVPPPLLCDPDCDTTSRNLDQFLAEMQVLDTIDNVPQNFFPKMDWTRPEDDHLKNWDVDSAADQLPDPDDKPPQNFAPVMDWTADYDWQRWLDLSSAPDDVQYEEYYHPAPSFPLFGWDEVDWQHSTDTRVVEDEDEREIPWPIPAAQVFNAKIDWTADYDWAQFRSADPGVGSAALVDEPAARAFFPVMDWTADYDWEQSRDTRVVEDEDAPAARPFAPSMDWTSDPDWEQFRSADPGSGSAALVDEPAALPFSPTLAWDDWDWSRSVDTRVIVQDDEDTRSLQAIALQVVAMSLQQMLAVPLLGLQSMTLESAEMSLQQMMNVMMLGLEEMENEV
jgi:hypothetical protein